MLFSLFLPEVLLDSTKIHVTTFFIFPFLTLFLATLETQFLSNSSQILSKLLPNSSQILSKFLPNSSQILPNSFQTLEILSNF